MEVFLNARVATVGRLSDTSTSSDAERVPVAVENNTETVALPALRPTMYAASLSSTNSGFEDTMLVIAFVGTATTLSPSFADTTIFLARSV
ncbi:hypothetical protein D3C85_1714330 [compost metagenome]